MKFLISVLSFAIFAPFVQAIEIPKTDAIKSIQIQNYYGSIQVVQRNSQNYQLMVSRQNPTGMSEEVKETVSAWRVTKNSDNGVLTIAVVPPIDKTVWKKGQQSGGRFPEYILQLTGPSLPIGVSLKRGNVDIKDWLAPVQVTQLEGALRVSGGEGALALSLQKGTVDVEGRKGEVKMDLFDVKGQIVKTAGDISFKVFDGSVILEDIEGNIAMQGHKGLLHGKRIKGRVEFDSRSNKTLLEDIDGAIRGKNAEGDVQIETAHKADITVKSGEGNVSLILPRSGASVSLGSQTGALAVPNYLKLTRFATIKVKSGRLRGGVPGRVYVRSQSGAIRLK